MLTDLNSQTRHPKLKIQYDKLHTVWRAPAERRKHWVDKCYTATRRTMHANTIRIFEWGSGKKKRDPSIRHVL